MVVLATVAADHVPGGPVRCLFGTRVLSRFRCEGHDDVMRARLVLGIVTAAVLMTPHAAQAVCFIRPFDQVVRQSDAVLVGTVADARSRGLHRTGIILRIDVEEALKGSAEDGQRVVVSSCGPVIAGPNADAMAAGMIGQRQLFLLQKDGSGLAYEFGGMLSPRDMTLDEQVARASRVLGVTPQVIQSSPSAKPTVLPPVQGVESDSLSRA